MSTIAWDQLDDHIVAQRYEQSRRLLQRLCPEFPIHRGTLGDLVLAIDAMLAASQWMEAQRQLNEHLQYHRRIPYAQPVDPARCDSTAKPPRQLLERMGRESNGPSDQNLDSPAQP